jgi:hypothetical protein
MFAWDYQSTNISQWAQQSRCLKLPYLRTETDSVSETLCSLEYRTTDKVQKPSNPDRQNHLEATCFSRVCSLM